MTLSLSHLEPLGVTFSLSIDNLFRHLLHHASFCLCRGTAETAVDTGGPKTRTGTEDPGIFLPIPRLTAAKLSSIFVLT